MTLKKKKKKVARKHEDLNLTSDLWLLSRARIYKGIGCGPFAQWYNRTRVLDAHHWQIWLRESSNSFEVDGTQSFADKLTNKNWDQIPDKTRLFLNENFSLFLPDQLTFMRSLRVENQYQFWFWRNRQILQI